VRKFTKTSVKIIDALAEVRTEHHQNTNMGSYPYTRLLWLMLFNIPNVKRPFYHIL
jgi:hypothetical protein